MTGFRTGDERQRFAIDVVDPSEINVRQQIGYSPNPSGFNEAIELMPQWRDRRYSIVITDREPSKGSLDMLLGLMRDKKVAAAMRRAGVVMPHLENTIKKAMKNHDA